MKHSIKFGLMGGMILFCLSMSLTSCEDILGEWSKPVPNTVTPGGGSDDGGGSSAINATAITLDQTLKVIKLGGDALTITVNFTPSDATDKSVTWESSDPTIATVENGVVTPKALGIATITAKSGELSATCEVFVGNEVDLGASAYEAKNYDILKGNMGANQLTIPNDIKVAFNGVQTTKQIICSGDATIILADGSTNEVTVQPTTDKKAGIKIGGTGTTLTINGETAGTGTLTATGGDRAAGIGTNYSNSSAVTGGYIVINGGTVTATGGEYAAGIGTGKDYIGYSNTCGDITINGGTVTATGGYYGAGIGTGGADGSSNTCGAIKINGGKVTATGGGNAAGIGTGLVDDGVTNECGAITIDTGVTSVTATKGDYITNSIGVGGILTSGTQTCGDIYFDIKVATAGAYSITTTDGTYTHGGLNLAISGNDWTLTPAN